MLKWRRWWRTLVGLCRLFWWQKTLCSSQWLLLEFLFIYHFCWFCRGKHFFLIIVEITISHKLKEIKFTFNVFLKILDVFWDSTTVSIQTKTFGEIDAYMCALRNLILFLGQGGSIFELFFNLVPKVEWQNFVIVAVVKKKKN